MIDFIDTKLNQVGDFGNSRKDTLKGYVAERKLVRIIKSNRDEVEKYLFSKYNISPTVSLKIKETAEQKAKRLKYNNSDPYETYDSSELLISKFISLSAHNCIEALDIYDYEGLHNMIDFVQKNFPILQL